jgi:hypothetical protein
MIYLDCLTWIIDILNLEVATDLSHINYKRENKYLIALAESFLKCVLQDNKLLIIRIKKAFVACKNWKCGYLVYYFQKK